MPRPCKRRRVCKEPSCSRFGPRNVKGDEEAIRMTVDEFETIRLIDLEGITQEMCAIQMNVARTTAQAIYNTARKKLAQCIVYGKELVIEGGHYVLCDGDFTNSGCGKKCCHMQQQEAADAADMKGEYIMKVAVTFEDGKVFQHFGHTEFFKLYEVENNKVVSSTVMSTNGKGHGALAGILKEQNVNVLICGGIGGGAQNALTEAGIKFFGGVSGDADAAVTALLEGNLNYNANVKCNHHGEEHGHGGTCGEHGCGNH